MEIKSPKIKKKSSMSRLVSWSKVFRTPILVVFLLGTSTCDTETDIVDHANIVEHDTNIANKNYNSINNLTSILNSEYSEANVLNFSNSEHHHRYRHNRVNLNDDSVNLIKKPSITKQTSINFPIINRNVLSDMRYLRRNLNKQVVNFIMTDVLQDGEVENRIHFNGITAKETYVGSDRYVTFYLFFGVFIIIKIYPCYSFLFFLLYLGMSLLYTVTLSRLQERTGLRATKSEGASVQIIA